MRCRRSQTGSVTVLGLGFVLLILFVGGMSIDLWRVAGTRRALAEIADAAAAAGANGLDRSQFRAEGRLMLDPSTARRLAAVNLARQADLEGLRATADVAATQAQVVVVVRASVELTLLRLFTLGEPIEVTVRAEAAPRGG